MKGETLLSGYKLPLQSAAQQEPVSGDGDPMRVQYSPFESREFVSLSEGEIQHLLRSAVGSDMPACGVNKDDAIWRVAEDGIQAATLCLHSLVKPRVVNRRSRLRAEDQVQEERLRHQ